MKLISTIKCAAVVAALSLASQAFAISYDFTTIWSSSGTPAGPAPYATLTVTQAGAGVVQLQINANNLGSGEFISFFKYNIEGSATSSVITPAIITDIGPGTTTFAFLASPGTDASKSFDAEVNFPTSGSGGGVNRFTDNESFVWTLSRAGLTVDNIDLDMMIHIQGIAGGGSAKVIASTNPGIPGVPDSGATIALLGVAVGLLVVARRKLV